MSHRLINNVGYKKIYPMSLCEDDSFCHYCGRTADILRALHWDHVPALNVRIPDGCEGLRKTLVRACSECNGLASDLPHMDYLERHFALKTLLIQRYYRLMLSPETYAEELGLSGQAFYLNAAVNNQAVLREQIFAAVGFGVHDINQIESPFLRRKNSEGKTIASLLLKYLTPAPVEPEPEEHQQSYALPADPLTELRAWTADEFILFLQSENRALPKYHRIYSRLGYIHWLRNHPTRAEALELPIDPDSIVGFFWPSARVNEQ